MRKLALATAAAVALLFTAPSFTGVTTPAEAQTVVKKKVVIKHGDRGRHMGRSRRPRPATWLAPSSRRQEGRDHQARWRITATDRDQEEDHRG